MVVFLAFFMVNQDGQMALSLMETGQQLVDYGKNYANSISEFLLVGIKSILFILAVGFGFILSPELNLSNQHSIIPRDRPNLWLSDFGGMNVLCTPEEALTELFLGFIQMIFAGLLLGILSLVQHLHKKLTT